MQPFRTPPIVLVGHSTWTTVWRREPTPGESALSVIVSSPCGCADPRGVWWWHGHAPSLSDKPVVGGALAVVSTLNLNLAAREEMVASVRLELARAGIDQFLLDLDAGFIDLVTSTAVPSGVGVIIQQNFVQAVLPNPWRRSDKVRLTDARRAALPDARATTARVPAPSPSCTRTRLPYPTAPGMPIAKRPAMGYGQRMVLLFAVDVIATARIGGGTAPAVHGRAVRRWDYVAAAAQQIFVTTAGRLPHDHHRGRP